jgi:hypothetical protein
MTIREFRQLLALEPDQEAEIGKVYLPANAGYTEWSSVEGLRPMAIRSLSPRLPKRGVEIIWGPGIRVLKQARIQKRLAERERRPLVRKTMIEGTND